MTLNDHLDGLRQAVEDYRAATAKAESMLLGRLAAAEDDTAALRDELHESVTALSNRIEANSPRGIFACDPDESGGHRE